MFIIGFGARHTFTLLAFLGFVNILAMNICLSVVIVAMVAKKGKRIDYVCLQRMHVFTLTGS
jgi:hypothetical protein